MQLTPLLAQFLKERKMKLLFYVAQQFVSLPFLGRVFTELFSTEQNHLQLTPKKVFRYLWQQSQEF